MKLEVCYNNTEGNKALFLCDEVKQNSNTRHVRFDLICADGETKSIFVENIHWIRPTMRKSVFARTKNGH